jgi:hypothetical protein
VPAIDDEDRIPLGAPGDIADDDFEDGPDLGPDARDRDLMDGSWEQRYYAGKERKRDWSFIQLAIALMFLLGLIVPGILVFTR